MNSTSHWQHSATVISHLWKGAAPNLIANPTKIKVSPSSESKTPILKSPPTKKSKDAKVWVKKYLIEHSLENFLLNVSKIGIKAKVFNSNPSQEIKIEQDEKTKKTLRKILIENKKIEGVSHIWKGGETYQWGMSPLA